MEMQSRGRQHGELRFGTSGKDSWCWRKPPLPEKIDTFVGNMKLVLPPPATSTWIPGTIMSATNAEAAFVVALMIPAPYSHRQPGACKGGAWGSARCSTAMR